VIEYTVGGDRATLVSARAVWGLAQPSLVGPLKASGSESIVRCVLCGSIFRLGDAHVTARGQVAASDWSCIERTCSGGLAAFVPASAPEALLRLAL